MTEWKLDIQRNNDRAGLIFLFSLISLVFAADFLIEISKTSLFQTASSTYEIYQSESLTVFDGTQENAFCPDTHDVSFRRENNGSETPLQGHKQLSIFFFLFSSFCFYYLQFFKVRKDEDTTLNDTSFYISGGSGYFAFPRPPPLHF